MLICSCISYIQSRLSRDKFRAETKNGLVNFGQIRSKIRASQNWLTPWLCRTWTMVAIGCKILGGTRMAPEIKRRITAKTVIL